MTKLSATFCRKPVSVACGGLAFMIYFTGILADPAVSRERHHRYRHVALHPPHQKSHIRGGLERTKPVAVATQNIAAIVVDANTGHVLYASKEHDLRRPASITKVMTLYLLFEQLEKGRLRLDSMIPISARAAAQAPTKLGLRPGDSISVDNAIKAIVTRSANDIAVAVAEAVGGDEASFAEAMTRRARALGMARTSFANASGLPHDEQLTTAHDLALLGRAIQDHFPRYYSYFATRTFTYRGTSIHNHNHLLERVEGMDGIKTGYTQASGFNLLTSVKRNGRHIVAVVLGGRTAAHRDRIMADLIEDQIGEGSPTRLVGPVPLPGTAASQPVAPVALRAAAVPAPVEPPVERAVAARPDPKLPFVPVSLKPGLTIDAMPVGTIGLARSYDRPQPAYVSASARSRPEEDVPAPPEKIQTRALFDGSTRAPASALTAPTTTPSAVRRPRALVPPEAIAADKAPAARPGAAATSAGASADFRRPPAGGWMIQIGATDDVSKANDLLARARLEGPKALGAAQPTTERVQKGSETLYRARFVGLEAGTAESACKTLKRSGFECFAARN